MMITRCCLRISLGGGGTDLLSYYREHSGFLIAAAIDKSVYITLHQTFVQELIIKYSTIALSAVADLGAFPSRAGSRSSRNLPDELRPTAASPGNGVRSGT